MTTEYKPFGLFAEIVGTKNKRALTPRQEARLAQNITAKYRECGQCGATWSLDDGDDCEYC